MVSLGGVMLWVWPFVSRCGFTGYAQGKYLSCLFLLSADDLQLGKCLQPVGER
jgi:hypothetical protein